MDVPRIKIENESASLNNGIADEDAACTDGDNLSFQDRGNSFLPNDSEFGCIESATRHTSIYIHEDWYQCIKTARQSNKFVVYEMKRREFFPTKQLEQSITEPMFQEILLKRKRTAYIRDSRDSNTITDQEKQVHIVATTLAKKNKQIKALQRTNRKLLKKIEDLNELLKELRKRSVDVSLKEV